MGGSAVRAALDDRRLARFLVQFANVVLSQKPVRAAVGGLAGRACGPVRFITG
ncbi:acyl-CoA hydrolase [Burkholderia ubonensis subsp. mesacidophila]|uniref:Acyl-CoA hydrolase n=1 Tax=Burkholderia ubonensis subsp. mesacidophila TaxID=265293 RepID=A0A2A4FGA2_9BURK|nr:acyl-CoA hydrolase [Burkholderia ubonensis subsp. mesacidophila]